MGEGMSGDNSLPKGDALQALSHEDFATREISEGNPDNYEVKMYSGSAESRKSFFETLKRGSQMSGQIDLRGETSRGDKYKVWVGADHMSLAIVAKFPKDDSVSTNDYMIGMVFNFDTDLRKIKLGRGNDIGNGSKRTDGQIESIAKAVETVLQIELINADEMVLKSVLSKCLLEGYHFTEFQVAIIDKNAKKISEIAKKEKLADRVEGYEDPSGLAEKREVIILPNFDVIDEDRALKTIEKLYGKLADKDGATIRIGFLDVPDRGKAYEIMERIATKIEKSDKNVVAHVSAGRKTYVEDANGNKIPEAVSREYCFTIIKNVY